MSADFAAVDWGTSSFRLWLMGRDGRVFAESRSAEGMQHCAQAGFAPVLQAHLEQVGAAPDLPVLICGMAGARQGWAEAPYAALPAPVAAIAGMALHLADDLSGGRDIHILPGLARRDPARPDVMRGEETQLLGLALSGVEGLVCLPGTHCKWAELARGAVVDFRSYMTGEIFDLLSRQSVLRHAMPDSRNLDADSPAFTGAVAETLADPGRAFAALFALRAGSLLGYGSPADAMARLSGLLIGAEIGQQQAARPMQSVVLVGQAGLGPLYAAALGRAGVAVTLADAELATRQGLLAAAKGIWGF